MLRWTLARESRVMIITSNQMYCIPLFMFRCSFVHLLIRILLRLLLYAYSNLFALSIYQYTCVHEQSHQSTILRRRLKESPVDCIDQCNICTVKNAPKGLFVRLIHPLAPHHQDVRVFQVKGRAPDLCITLFELAAAPVVPVIVEDGKAPR